MATVANASSRPGTQADGEREGKVVGCEASSAIPPLASQAKVLAVWYCCCCWPGANLGALKLRGKNPGSSGASGLALSSGDTQRSARRWRAPSSVSARSAVPGGERSAEWEALLVLGEDEALEGRRLQAAPSSCCCPWGGASDTPGRRGGGEACEGSAAGATSGESPV